MAFRSRIQSSVRWGFHCALRIPRLFDAIGVATVGFWFVFSTGLDAQEPIEAQFSTKCRLRQSTPGRISAGGSEGMIFRRTNTLDIHNTCHWCISFF